MGLKVLYPGPFNNVPMFSYGHLKSSGSQVTFLLNELGSPGNFPPRFSAISLESSSWQQRSQSKGFLHANMLVNRVKVDFLTHGWDLSGFIWIYLAGVGGNIP